MVAGGTEKSAPDTLPITYVVKFEIQVVKCYDWSGVHCVVCHVSNQVTATIHDFIVA